MPYTGSRKEAERRRIRAMTLRDQGQTQAQVARLLGVTAAAVCQWDKARRQGGAAALKAKPHSGPKPKLNASQMRRLERLLLQGPRTHGYATELWTLPRIAELIGKRFAVTYDPSAVWHVMRRMNWSPQKPERRARERDEKAIQRWRTRDWRRIKKRPAQP